MTSIPPGMTPEAAWARTQMFRRMSPEQRMLLGLRMNDYMRSIVTATIRTRYPELSEERVKLAMIRTCLGDELFGKAFPGVDVPALTHAEYDHCCKEAEDSYPLHLQREEFANALHS